MGLLMKELAQYNKEIPGDLRRALDALSDNKARGLVVLLLDEGELSFTEIKQKTGIHQQTLTDLLDKLQNGGITVRDETVVGDDYHAKYRTTSFGRRILDGLFEAYLPSIAEKRAPTATKSEVYDQGRADKVYTDVEIYTRDEPDNRTKLGYDKDDLQNSFSTGDEITS